VANPPPLIHGYISSNRVADFIDQLKLKIIKNLMPGLHKEGYSEGLTLPRLRVILGEVPQLVTPLVHSPSFLLMGLNAFSANHLTLIPLEIGRRDLDPLGVDPLGGFGPPHYSLVQVAMECLLAQITPSLASVGEEGFPPNRGPWGGDGYLPPMGAPPGARFDPVGPGSIGNIFIRYHSLSVHTCMLHILWSASIHDSLRHLTHIS
jgi:proteasome inhibitor subunit 1 (PI31)